MASARSVAAKVTVEGEAWLRELGRAAEGAAALLRAHPAGFDDILIYGMPDSELVAALAPLLKPGGTFAIEGRGAAGRAPIDIGSVHYRGHWYSGRPAGNVYEWDRTAELLPGGIAWFIGGIDRDDFKTLLRRSPAITEEQA